MGDQTLGTVLRSLDLFWKLNGFEEANHTQIVCWKSCFHRRDSLLAERARQEAGKKRE